MSKVKKNTENTSVSNRALLIILSHIHTYIYRYTYTYTYTCEYYIEHENARSRTPFVSSVQAI